MTDNTLIVLGIHFTCGIIATGIVARVEYKTNHELTVGDLVMLWMIPLGFMGLLLCLMGLWYRFFEKYQGKVLISRKSKQVLKEPHYVLEQWK